MFAQFEALIFVEPFINVDFLLELYHLQSNLFFFLFTFDQELFMPLLL